MTRLPNWDSQLANFVSSRVGQPFVWGANDCGHWTADAVMAITGRDYLGSLRGSWTSEFGYLRTLARFGSLDSLVSSILGPSSCRIARVSRGDVVLIEGLDPSEEWLGICFGSHVYSVNETLPLSHVKKFWSV